MPRMLAFDASSTVGWASFASAKARPVCDSFDVPSGPDHGRRNLAMFDEVRRLISLHRPEIIAFEAPIFLPRDRWHTRRLLTGLVNMVELAATMAKLRCIEVAPNTAKACLTGNATADKDEMLIAAVNMGWRVGNHHQADACAVALAAYGHLANRSNTYAA